MNLPLEDNFEDIIAKAQKGSGVSTEALAARTGVAESVVRGLRRGVFEAGAAAAVAEALGLRVEPLLRIAAGAWSPDESGPRDGFQAFTTRFTGGSVNSYLVWQPGGDRALAIDAGAEASAMVAFAKKSGLRIEALLLTHAHRDHVGGAEELRKSFGLPVYLGRGEKWRGETLPVEDGQSWKVGGLAARAVATPGHSPDAYSYVVEGLERPVAMVGDALFAGSMGGAFGLYEDSLEALGRILELSEDTVLCPGHGPLTSVAEERGMNCFYTIGS